MPFDPSTATLFDPDTAEPVDEPTAFDPESATLFDPGSATLYEPEEEEKESPFLLVPGVRAVADLIGPGSQDHGKEDEQPSPALALSDDEVIDLQRRIKIGMESGNPDLLALEKLRSDPRVNGNLPRPLEQEYQKGLAMNPDYVPGGQKKSDIPSIGEELTRAANAVSEAMAMPVKEGYDGVNRPINAINTLQKAAFSVLGDIPKAKAFLDSSVARAFGKESDPRKSPFYIVSKALETYFDYILPTNPDYEKEFLSGQLPSGVGSTLGFALGGAGSAGAKGIAALGAATSGAQGGEEALEAGGTEGQRDAAFYANAAVGLSEAAPIERALRHLDRFTGGAVTEIIKKGVVGGIEELVQEVFQNISGNLIASDIVKYDEDREAFTGTVEAGEVGFAVGFLMNVLTAAVGGRRAREPGKYFFESKDKAIGKEMQDIIDNAEAVLPDDAGAQLLDPSRAQMEMVAQGVEDIQNAPTVDDAIERAETILQTEFEGETIVPQEEAGLDLSQSLDDFLSETDDTDEGGGGGSTTTIDINGETATIVDGKVSGEGAALDAAERIQKKRDLRHEEAAELAKKGEIETPYDIQVKMKVGLTRANDIMDGLVDDGILDAPVEEEDPGDAVIAEGDTDKPLAIQEIPLDELTLSDEVPQFKSGANEEGVVEPLGGKFERTGVAPIVVWERLDGRKEVISGRHRLDLARRSGETTIPGQILREADGLTADKAAILDAEMNLRDGQGKVKDYVSYFKGTGITREEAESRGLLARAKGQRSFTIADQGSDELVAAHRAGQISDAQAFAIAQNAPGNSEIQNVGIKAVQDGRSTNDAVNIMKAVLSTSPQGEEVDMFGFDDSAMKSAVEMAKIASRKQRQISTDLKAIQGAAKNPEVAARYGVDVKDAEGLKQVIADLKSKRAAWDQWHTSPDLIREIESEMSGEKLEIKGRPEEEAPEYENILSFESKEDGVLVSVDKPKGKGQISVTMKDLDTGKTLPTAKLFDDEAEAIEYAKSIAPEYAGFELSSETEEERAARESAQAAAEAREAAKRVEEEQRVKADEEAAGGLVLTGSDRPADVLAAGGQQDLLSAPDTNTREEIDEAGKEAATSPENDLNASKDQLKRGNYKKAHVKVLGHDITIENPKGSERKGTDSSGKPWSVTLKNDYGYIKKTRGADDEGLDDKSKIEHVDAFIGPTPESETIYVVNQYIDGKFDEHKVVFGAESEEQARQIYLDNYEPGWDGLNSIVPMSREQFEEWVYDPEQTSKELRPEKKAAPKKIVATKEDLEELLAETEKRIKEQGPVTDDRLEGERRALIEMIAAKDAEADSEINEAAESINETIWYRGQHGEGTGIQTRVGLATFTDSRDIAELYAREPNDYRDSPKNPNLITFIANIKNPAVLTEEDDPFVEYRTLKRLVGKDLARRFFEENEEHVANTDNYYDVQDRYGFTTLADLSEHGMEQMYVSFFPVADDPEIQRALQDAGYDSIVGYGASQASVVRELRVFDQEDLAFAQEPLPRKKQIKAVTPEMVGRAMEIAEKAHKGQTDKAGAPYIEHIGRVRDRAETDEEKVAAILHDSIEDTDLSLDDLRSEFPESIVAAVDALTKREGESRMDAAKRARRNPIARRVKGADLADNMDLGRIRNPSAEDIARQKEYEEVNDYLSKPERINYSDHSLEEANRLEKDFRSSMSGFTFASIYDVAEKHQKEIDALGKSISGGLPGTRWKNPGVKKKLKAVGKLRKKGGAQHLKDIVRGGFYVNTPEQSDIIADAIAERYDIFDEGWFVNDAGYFDRKLIVRFEDGLLGEIQFWHPDMEDAKSNRGGHDMYDEASALPIDDPQRDVLIQKMRDLYGAVVDSLPPEWDEVLGRDGSGGTEGNISLNSSSESGLASIATSAESTSSQESPTKAQATPRSMTAGSVSNEKNFIESPPSSTDIVPDREANISPDPLEGIDLGAITITREAALEGTDTLFEIEEAAETLLRRADKEINMIQQLTECLIS